MSRLDVAKTTSYGFEAAAFLTCLANEANARDWSAMPLPSYPSANRRMQRPGCSSTGRASTEND